MARQADAQDDGRGVPLSPEAVVSFELILRYAPSSQAAIEDEARRLMAGASPSARDRAAAARSADPGDVEHVRAFLTKAGLTVDSVDPATRSIHVSGSAAAVAKLFGVSFVEHAEGPVSWRDYRGQVRLPPELEEIVVSTLGLSTKPIAAHDISTDPRNSPTR